MPCFMEDDKIVDSPSCRARASDRILHSPIWVSELHEMARDTAAQCLLCNDVAICLQVLPRGLVQA